MINKRKLLYDYISNIEDNRIKNISIQVLSVYNGTKPKTETIREIKSIIEKNSEDANK